MTRSEGYVVRNAVGDFEVVGTRSPVPSIGATIRRRGKAWKVIDRFETATSYFGWRLHQKQGAATAPPDADT